MFIDIVDEEHKPFIIFNSTRSYSEFVGRKAEVLGLFSTVFPIKNQKITSLSQNSTYFPSFI